MLKRYKVLLQIFPVLSFSFIQGGCGDTRIANRYLIPDGYVGWVCVEYRVRHEKPLVKVNGYNIIQIPTNGFAKTSSIPESGSAVDEFYYVKDSVYQRLDSWSGPTGSTKIWGMIISGGKTIKNGDASSFTGLPSKECFFVGSGNQFKKFGYDMRPKPGPITVNKQ